MLQKKSWETKKNDSDRAAVWELWYSHHSNHVWVLPGFVFQGGKVLNYANFEQTANVIFVVFTVVFMVSRIIIFPFW